MRIIGKEVNSNIWRVAKGKGHKLRIGEDKRVSWSERKG